MNHNKEFCGCTGGLCRTDESGADAALETEGPSCKLAPKWEQIMKANISQLQH